VLELARRRFLSGERIDVRAIANELGLGRATIYRWFGSREQLVGDVLMAEAQELFRASRARARGVGARRLLDTFDRINRALAAAPPLRTFLEAEREAALRIITSSGGPVQPRAVAAIALMIEEEVVKSGYEPPVEPVTMAYAIVRLAEAFIYNDAVAGIRGDVDRLREVEAALLGTHP
jgi:AcrR family transcriptional regulator